MILSNCMTERYSDTNSENVNIHKSLSVTEHCATAGGISNSIVHAEQKGTSQRRAPRTQRPRQAGVAQQPSHSTSTYTRWSVLQTQQIQLTSLSGHEVHLGTSMKTKHRRRGEMSFWNATMLKNLGKPTKKKSYIHCMTNFDNTNSSSPTRARI